MAAVLGTRALLLRPDHLILLLRDIDCDAGAGAGAAITQAQQHIAASSGYGIYVEAAQNLIAVRVTVEVWDAAPGAGTGWTGPIPLELDCPSGQLQVGDDMGNVIDGIVVAHGPGRYHVAVYHRGRDTALDHERRLTGALAAGTGGERIDRLRDAWEGTEEYLFRLWWHSPLPDDEDDEGAGEE